MSWRYAIRNKTSKDLGQERLIRHFSLIFGFCLLQPPKKFAAIVQPSKIQQVIRSTVLLLFRCKLTELANMQKAGVACFCKSCIHDCFHSFGLSFCQNKPLPPSRPLPPLATKPVNYSSLCVWTHTLARFWHFLLFDMWIFALQDHETKASSASSKAKVFRRPNSTSTHSAGMYSDGTHSQPDYP